MSQDVGCDFSRYENDSMDQLYLKNKTLNFGSPVCGSQCIDAWNRRNNQEVAYHVVNFPGVYIKSKSYMYVHQLL